MKSEYFWSLIIEPGWVSSAIWKVDGEIIDVESVSKSSSWEDHNMVEVVDASLTDSINDLPEDIKEPSKTVFGVPAFWVEEGKIKDKNLEKIKEICTKLSLSPTGFVVMPEAIAHSSKIKDGNPLTSILVGIYDNMIDLTLFKLGNLIGTVNVGRSISLVEDVEEGLSRFGIKDPLPTRILLYGGSRKELEKSKQDLVMADWEQMKEKGLSFLHTPQFEIFSNEEKSIAVSVAGASEMTTIKTVNVSGISVNSLQIPDEEIDLDTNLEAEENVQVTNDLSAEDVGFVIDEDIAELQNEVEIQPETEEIEAFPTLPTTQNKIKTSFPKISKPSFKIVFPKAKAAFFILFFVLVSSVVGFFAFWWFFPKAEVVVYISPKQLEEQESLVLDENIESPDIESRIFPAKQLKIVISDTKEKKSTGKITVGEKAKGSITVRNGTSDPVKLSSGDIVVGPGGLEFEIIESASVSAALSPTEPGQSTVNAEASDIGAEYNIAKDESLSVDGFSKSQVDAIVATSFSGGNSKEITAVSQADLNALESEILSELKRKGISEIESTAGDARFIPESVKTNVVEEKYSASVGEESEYVSVSLTLEVKGIAITNETISQLGDILLSEQVPDGFKLKNENIEASFEFVDEVEDGVYDFDVSLVARLLPEVNIDSIKNEIMGKYPPDAESLLIDIQGFSKAEVSLNPRFPGRLGIIPRIPKNISIEIVAER